MSLWYKDSDPGLMKAAKLIAWSIASPIIAILLGILMVIVCMIYGAVLR